MNHLRNTSPGSKVFNVFLYVFLVLISFIFFYPVWQTFVVSFSHPEYVRSLGLKLWPPQWSLDSYALLFENSMLLVGLSNTLFRTVLGTSLMIVVTFLGGYVLTKKKMPFHGAMLVYIMIPMFFSGGLIPSYINVKNLGLMNNLWLFVISGATSTWYLLLTRNFIQTLPESLEESAMIDGAHPLRIVFRIIMPLCLPIIAVLALWGAVGHWNSWYDALLYAPQRAKMVLALVVRKIVIENDDTMITGAAASSADLGVSGVMTGEGVLISPESLKAAAIFFSIAPIMALYPFLQKYFVKGILVGSVKG